MSRTRVLLAAHGEAETGGFADTFRVGWRTLSHAAEVIPLPAPVRLAICGLAALRRTIGGGNGSTHNGHTRRQAAALQARLDREGGTDYRVEAAFTSVSPTLGEAITRPTGFDRLVVISMIPTDSRLACGLICRTLGSRPSREHSPATVLARMWDSPGLIEVHRQHLAAQLQREDTVSADCLVLLLHGTLVRDRRGRVPDFHTGVHEKTAYAEALREAMLTIPRRSWTRIEVAYLNHGIGGEWSSPTLSSLLTALAAEGVDRVDIYPCEHLVDGRETAALPAVLQASPMAAGRVLPCVNASPPFIEYLARRLLEATEGEPSSHRCDACPASDPEDCTTPW